MAGAAGLGLATDAAAESSADLSKLSIEELGNVEVTSVSKRPEAIGQAAAAVYVITHDDIVRSGALSLPEILRLAPNLQVAQTSASGYVVTARGLNGAPAAQNFSNKLLVLIDGRSVYTPLFSGVYWDMQDVMPQDIERIEVISGPGATLWGANAVNGVINVITRRSADTQGGLLAVSAGDQGRSASLRYGGRISESLTYRVYGRSFLEKDSLALAGGRAHDHWSKPQAGFRLDWGPSPADSVTLQGDAYDGAEAQAGASAEDIRGGNLTARWSHALAGGSSLQVQAYYDRAERGAEVDGSGFQVDTYDLDLQHGFTLGDQQEVVWGGGYRVSRYHIDGTSTLSFAPAGRTLALVNLFAQDTLSFGNATRLVLGVKVEDDPYVGPELLPNVRLSWAPNAQATLWAAVSRAVRSPTPFDRDVVEKLGGRVFLIGGPDFQTEKLTAYEVGTKLAPSDRASISVSAFYNVYDDLRSIEVAPGGFVPLRWGNRMTGRTYGMEAWGDYQVTRWWRLSASFNALEERFKFAAGASGLLGTSQAANDPKYQAQLKSSADLGAVTVDAALRYASALPDPRVPAYVELNGRVGWNLTDRLQLAVSGHNLLHDSHREYPGASRIPRAVFIDLQWRF